MSTNIGYSGMFNPFSSTLCSRGGGAGGGGAIRIIADDNGTVFDQAYNGLNFRFHRFTSTGDNSLYIRGGAGATLYVWMWGAAGGRGGQGGANGGAGGMSYGEITVQDSWVSAGGRMRIYVGGGGGGGNGCYGCWGGGGNGTNGSGYGSGGRGTHASCRGCSAGGGGGGAATMLFSPLGVSMSGDHILQVAGGGGGGGGREGCSGAGNGGAGGQRGANGQCGSQGGGAGSNSDTNGDECGRPGNDASGGGGGGGGYNAGHCGGNPGCDCNGAAGGGGGNSWISSPYHIGGYISNGDWNTPGDNSSQFRQGYAQPNGGSGIATLGYIVS